MVNINRAFEVDSLYLGDTIVLTAGSFDPSVDGQESPIGSLFIRNNGQLWQKTGNLDTDWVKNDPGSGAPAGPSDEYNGNILTVIDYSASDKVLIFVDSENQAINIILPLAASYKNKFFHIKWINGKNKVTITAQTGETIDGETSIILGELMDSLQIVSNESTWYIV